MPINNKSRQYGRPVRRKPSLDFSITGLIYCTIMMFIGLAAINIQNNLLFGVFGLMIGILIVSFFISGMVIRRLDIERVMPDHAVVGQPAIIYYKITNRKKFWPSLSVTISELDGVLAFARQPTAYMLHCANKSTAEVPAEVIPRRRGVFAFDRYQSSTSFPFGFVKRAVDRRQKDSIVVLPAVGQMRPQLLQRFRSAESAGDNLRPSKGGDDEFYGVREYREGENPKHIYWKRSARTGQLVVREMTRVSPPRVLVVVDCAMTGDGRDAYIAAERAIAMAATLIDSAMEAGLPVGLVAVAPSVDRKATDVKTTTAMAADDAGGGGGRSGSRKAGSRTLFSKRTPAHSTTVQTADLTSANSATDVASISSTPATGEVKEVGTTTVFKAHQTIKVAPSRGKRHRLELLTHLSRLSIKKGGSADGLLNEARTLMESDTTVVLITSGNPAGGFGRSNRESVVTIQSAGTASGRYFAFAHTVDFSLGFQAKEKV